MIAAGALIGLVMPVAFRTEPTSPPITVRTTVHAGQLASAPQVPFTGMMWRDYHGVLLPYSADDGPRDTANDLATGFARTPRGALLAAVHIVVRANVRWGPKVFEPTIEDQVIGPDAEALLAAAREAYEELRGDRPDGEALGRGYVVLEGFRWQGYSPAAASVDLVSAGPGDSDVTVRAVTRVQVQWQGGDWRVVGPPGGTWAGSAAPVDSTDGYVRFPGGGA
ncbi:hypothetical protein [Actinomadura sp. 6K520]|uniref:hypothetical protein n=1 Tax=Actinomadura sp. 6K520 TaxID=2530364 RepID=UPI001044A5EC|nr:hypothetical protein [Actinomadura sp. 6K520]TDE22062.1 hypothetical protein E1289_30280 [Actinomadura sp. 6K520]